ncbi:protein LKAAEAR1-like [Salmo trutta]|uniref:Protein LKAAEAR1-like n=1 Tax=Salmo trutta TaxID=8032 RepID=A0A673XQP8_SALTR|nr:protein LKAAEAR1-like [Salmo trutta]
MTDAPAKPYNVVCRNWRNATAAELREMCPQQKARYLAYEEPPKEAQGVMAVARQRVCARLTECKGRQATVNAAQQSERARRDTIIGQLKAAEARNRVCLMRLRHQNIRTQDISLMIACQPTAQRAVRLELLLPQEETGLNVQDPFDKLQRKRVEQLLDKSLGTLERRW